MPRTQHPGEEHFTVLPGNTSVIADARACVADWVAEWTDDAEAVADLTVVTSELVGNAVAASDDDDPVLLAASHADGAVVLQVANRVRADVPATPQWRLDEPLRGGGRGLLIVKSLVDRLEVESDGPWTVVRCLHRV